MPPSVQVPKHRVEHLELAAGSHQELRPGVAQRLAGFIVGFAEKERVVGDLICKMDFEEETRKLWAWVREKRFEEQDESRRQLTSYPRMPRFMSIWQASKATMKHECACTLA